MSHEVAPPRDRDGSPPARLAGSAFVGVVLGMVAYFAAFTSAPLIAEDLTGGARWAGLPGAAVILGTALGTGVLSELMHRRGRRGGLVAGWATGSGGAVIAVAATVLGSFPLFVAGFLLIGLGHGANQLARFAAADAQPVARRGRMVSLIVWGGTIGAVAGPAMVDAMGPTARVLGLDDLAGALVVTVAAFALAGLTCGVGMRPDPSFFAAEHAPRAEGRDTAGHARRTGVAVAALVVTQFVMLLVMTITPVHVRAHDHGLSGVGVVISLHVLGMFGLAPVAGWATDRFGALRVATGGLTVVALAAATAAVAPADNLPALAVALLLIGLGWSAAFVASSTLLARTGPKTQGRGDALAWSFAAIASLTSGVLVAAVGYPTLSWIGAGLAGLAAAVVAVEARRDVREIGRFGPPAASAGPARRHAHDSDRQSVDGCGE